VPVKRFDGFKLRSRYGGSKVLLLAYGKQHIIADANNQRTGSNAPQCKLNGFAAAAYVMRIHGLGKKVITEGIETPG